MSAPINRVIIVGSGWVGRQIAARLAAFGIAVGLTDKDVATIDDAYQWICANRDSSQSALAVKDARSNHQLQKSPSDRAVLPANAQEHEDRGGTDTSLTQDHDSRSAVTAGGVSKLPTLDQLTREELANWRPDLVMECVPEQLSLKKRVLRRTSQLVSEDCIITSNSSYFVPSLLAQFVQNPSRFAHLHFHVPVLRDSVADVVGCEATEPEILKRLADLCHRIEQHPLILKREHPGYLFNWLLQSVLKAALELVALDVAEIEDIDRSWKSVTGMTVGPFGMMDQIGIDVVEQVLSNARWVEPSTVDSQKLMAILRPLIEQGRLGTKANKGFYDY